MENVLNFKSSPPPLIQKKMPSENIVSFYFIRSYGPFKLWHNLCEANKKLEIYRPQFDAKSSTKAETLPHAKHHKPALHCNALLLSPFLLLLPCFLFQQNTFDTFWYFFHNNSQIRLMYRLLRCKIQLSVELHQCMPLVYYEYDKQLCGWLLRRGSAYIFISLGKWTSVLAPLLGAAPNGNAINVT